MAKTPEKSTTRETIRPPAPTPSFAVERRLGYKRDPEDGRDWSARGMLGAARAMPAEAMRLEGSVRHVLDQGDSSSCVGHAIAVTADTRLRFIGVIKEPPSPLAIYGVARALARGNKMTPFTDDGCWPRSAMKGIRDYGTAPLSAWPLDMAKVNAELPWDVLQKASAFKLDAFFRVDSAGRSRIEDVAHAISRGYPVIFGTDIDKKFQDYAGRGLATPAGAEPVGGHMLSLIGYSTSPAGRMIFRGVNSWGTGWGQHGFFWCGEDFLLDPRASDFYVIQVSP